jgi:hypothetical protein
MTTSAQKREPSFEGAKRLTVDLGGVEDGKVLSNDLLGRILLDALGAGVPRPDVPLGVQDEDRIIPDALHQQAIAVIPLDDRAERWRRVGGFRVI